MKEAPVEKRLTDGLTALGFKVLKLTTPGTNGTPDRMILRPRWSPGPPWVIEIKRPGKNEERLQELVRDDWRARGVLVLDMVNTYYQVDVLICQLGSMCASDTKDRAGASNVMKTLRICYPEIYESIPY